MLLFNRTTGKRPPRACRVQPCSSRLQRRAALPRELRSKRGTSKPAPFLGAAEPGRTGALAPRATGCLQVWAWVLPCLMVPRKQEGLAGLSSSGQGGQAWWGAGGLGPGLGGDPPAWGERTSGGPCTVKSGRPASRPHLQNEAAATTPRAQRQGQKHRAQGGHLAITATNGISVKAPTERLRASEGEPGSQTRVPCN